MTWRPSRRAMLRGLGAAVALPWLESLAPRSALATTGVAPRNLVIVFAPNGMRMDAWTPPDIGAGFTLSPTLQPLARHAGRFSVLGNLDNPGQQGIEPHMIASVAWLTGRRTLPWTLAQGAEFVSIDQLVAQAFASTSRFPSLELGSEAPASCTEALSGLVPSCAPYQTVSWANATTPLPREIRPQRLFERLFGGLDDDPAAVARRRRYDLAVLDAVTQDAADLDRKLASADRVRLDQYLTGVDTLERRLRDPGPAPSDACAAAARELASATDLGAALDITTHVRTMSELAVLALQCGQTRVVSYMLGNVRSDRPYPNLGVPESHHWVSHHGGDPSRLDKLQTIDTWQVERLAELLDLLQAAPGTGGGTLLDETIVLFGSCLGDPDTHARSPIPTVIAGGGGALRLGEHIALPRGATTDALHLTLARALGLSIPSFGELGTSELTALLP